MQICGIDDAGRGSMLGPLVIAGVSLEKKNLKKLTSLGVKDSKKLSSKKRNLLFKEIYKKALSIGVGIFNENIIDEINILKATFLAMKKSLGTFMLNP